MSITAVTKTCELKATIDLQDATKNGALENVIDDVAALQMLLEHPNAEEVKKTGETTRNELTVRLRLRQPTVNCLIKKRPRDKRGYTLSIRSGRHEGELYVALQLINTIFANLVSRQGNNNVASLTDSSLNELKQRQKWADSITLGRLPKIYHHMLFRRLLKDQKGNYLKLYAQKLPQKEWSSEEPADVDDAYTLRCQLKDNFNSVIQSEWVRKVQTSESEPIDEERVEEVDLTKFHGSRLRTDFDGVLARLRWFNERSDVYEYEENVDQSSSRDAMEFEMLKRAKLSLMQELSGLNDGELRVLSAYYGASQTPASTKHMQQLHRIIYKEMATFTLSDRTNINLSRIIAREHCNKQPITPVVRVLNLPPPKLSMVIPELLIRYDEFKWLQLVRDITEQHPSLSIGDETVIIAYVKREATEDQKKRRDEAKEMLKTAEKEHDAAERESKKAMMESDKDKGNEDNKTLAQNKLNAANAAKIELDCAKTELNAAEKDFEQPTLSRRIHLQDRPLPLVPSKADHNLLSTGLSPVTLAVTDDSVDFFAQILHYAQDRETLKGAINNLALKLWEWYAISTEFPMDADPDWKSAVYEALAEWLIDESRFPPKERGRDSTQLPDSVNLPFPIANLYLKQEKFDKMVVIQDDSIIARPTATRDSIKQMLLTAKYRQEYIEDDKLNDLLSRHLKMVHEDANYTPTVTDVFTQAWTVATRPTELPTGALTAFVTFADWKEFQIKELLPDLANLPFPIANLYLKQQKFDEMVVIQDDSIIARPTATRYSICQMLLAAKYSEGYIEDDKLKALLITHLKMVDEDETYTPTVTDVFTRAYTTFVEDVDWKEFQFNRFKSVGVVNAPASPRHMLAPSGTDRTGFAEIGVAATSARSQAAMREQTQRRNDDDMRRADETRLIRRRRNREEELRERQMQRVTGPNGDVVGVSIHILRVNPNDHPVRMVKLWNDHATERTQNNSYRNSRAWFKTFIHAMAAKQEDDDRRINDDESPRIFAPFNQSANNSVKTSVLEFWKIAVMKNPTRLKMIPTDERGDIDDYATIVLEAIKTDPYKSFQHIDHTPLKLRNNLTDKLPLMLHTPFLMNLLRNVRGMVRMPFFPVDLVLSNNSHTEDVLDDVDRQNATKSGLQLSPHQDLVKLKRIDWDVKQRYEQTLKDAREMVQTKILTVKGNKYTFLLQGNKVVVNGDRIRKLAVIQEPNAQSGSKVDYDSNSLDRTLRVPKPINQKPTPQRADNVPTELESVGDRTDAETVRKRDDVPMWWKVYNLRSSKWIRKVFSYMNGSGQWRSDDSFHLNLLPNAEFMEALRVKYQQYKHPKANLAELNLRTLEWDVARQTQEFEAEDRVISQELMDEYEELKRKYNQLPWKSRLESDTNEVYSHKLSDGDILNRKEDELKKSITKTLLLSKWLLGKPVESCFMPKTFEMFKPMEKVDRDEKGLNDESGVRRSINVKREDFYNLQRQTQPELEVGVTRDGTYNMIIQILLIPVCNVANLTGSEIARHLFFYTRAMKRNKEAEPSGNEA